jgi:hypothetical protein
MNVVRRIVVAAIAFAIAGALAASSWSAPSRKDGGVRSAKRVGCSGKSLTFLFWPQGHAAIETVKFPNFPVPHLEIYRTGAGYPGANFLGYVGPDGTAQFQPSCKSVAAPLVRARIASPATTHDTTALVCNFASAAQLDGSALTVGSRLLVIYPAKSAHQKAGIAAIAYVRPNGSTLTYNSKLCTPTPAPS